MQIDLGSILLVHGVVIQARADFPDQWVTEIEVQCSTAASNFVTATATGGGTRFFPTSTYSNQIKSQQRFNQPVGARYIKIIVHASAMPNLHGLAMRAGVLTSSFNQGNRSGSGSATSGGSSPSRNISHRGVVSGSGATAGGGSFQDASGGSGWGHGLASWDLPASIRGLMKSGYSHCSMTQAKVFKSTLFCDFI